MKKITYLKSLSFLITVLSVVSFSFGQTKITELTFETAGGYTTSIPEFTDGTRDYFLRTDGSDITGEAWINTQGSYYFAAQDIDGAGASLPVTLLINNINISGYTSLEFRVHLAEADDGANQDWDNPTTGVDDYVHISYDIDNSSSFNNLLWIEPNGTGINNEPSIDTDFDGTGDGTAITDTFTQFTENITGTGSLLDIEIEFSLNAGDEDIAIDNIEIWGIPAPCPTSVTWDGTAWIGGTPSSTTFVIIDGNYTATTANSFSACSLYINEVSSSTSNPVIVTVDNGGFIEVENDVTVNGTLIVETQGNFVQRGNTGTFNLNTGLGAVARVNKSTAAKSAWYFYTYWSSPVIGETIADAFPNVDGDRRFWFNAANFVDEHTVGTTNGIPDDIDDNGDDWQYALGGDIMTPGVGYAATESRLFIPPPGPGGASGTASFEGPFNTNDIDVSISENAANVAAGSTSLNFIGNPYPSAIDFDAFHAANSTVVGGAAYFWSQVSAPNTANAGNENFNFNKNDYAIYTVGSGSIVAGAGGIIPDQYIPSGQGFFIAGIDNNTATFTNAMRMADDTSNNQFFRNSNSKKKTSYPNTNRLWVNLTTDNGVFSQILLAYVDGATNGNDGLSYDAPKIVNQDFAAILYSSMDSDSKKYVIQGKNIDSINEDEIINLGFSSTIQTTTQYNLSIAQIEGDFLTSNTVYLKDNLLGTLHNLSDSDYTFTSEVGEFNTRFEIVFNANALSTEDLALENNTLKIIELEDDRVQFTTSSNIKAVRIYDLLGRQLYNFKGQSNSETYKLSNLSSTIYIAKVELLNGATITKKAFKK